MTKTDDIKKADLSEERGAEPVAEGDHVAWKWGGGMVEGTVAETSTEKMVKETKPGTNITRNGTEDNPAVYIEREGNNVVKKQSELYKVHDDS